MGTKTHNNYEDLITFTRASAGHALRPVSYGSELVTNGTFTDNIDGWQASSVNATLSHSTDTLQVVATGGGVGAVLTSAITVEVGKMYTVVAESTSSTGRHQVRVGNSSSTSSEYFTSDIVDGVATEFRTTFVATKTTLYVYLRSDNAGTTKWDNVSVKEVTFDQPDGTLTLFEHPASIPRVEYDADGNRLGLLVEEQRTNKVTYSEDLSQGSQVNNPTITTNIATAPDGTETVDGIQDTSGGNFKRVKLFSGAVSANSTYTGSLFVKKESVETNYGGIVLGFTAGTSNSTCYGIIDAVNGTISPATANNITATFTVTDVGDFWRFSITGTDTGSNTQLEFGVYGTLSVDGSTTGTGAGSVRRVWGAQVEAGSFPTSYIKSNSGSTTSRSADVASIPVANFGFNANAMTLFVEANNTDNCQVLTLIDDGSSANRIRIYESGSNVVGLATTGGTNVAVMVTSQSVVNDGLKAVIAAKKDDFVTVANAGSAVTDSAGNMPVGLTDLNIATPESGGATGAVHIKSIKYYPRRLTNAQLQDLTS